LVKVKKKKGESTRRLISRFKEKVSEEDIIDNAREAARFESPAERRKKKKYRLERMSEKRR
jgi:ribosomal protein S21